LIEESYLVPILTVADRPHDLDLIVFDKDGVLLDFRNLWARVTEARVEALCRLSGLDIAGELLTLLGLDAAGRILPGGLLAGGSRQDSTMAAATALHQAGLGWHLARHTAFEAFDAADGAMDYAGWARPLPHVVETVRALHAAGFKLAIATTDQTAGAHRFLAHSGLAGCFDAVVGVDLVARSKPAPDLFLMACQLAGVAPGRAAMVGDLDIDLRMARTAQAALSVGVLSGVGDTALLAPWADAVLPDVGGLLVAEPAEGR
jgi:phosphoglycolate phosphatase